jgi:hypothetical protein
VVDQHDGALEGGLVIAPTDRAAADHVFTTLRTAIALVGSQGGISVSDESYAGTTITTIDLGDIGGLLGLAGVQPDQLGAGTALPSGHVRLAYAISDGVVAIGSGPSFVKRILDTTTSTSIAATDRFKALIGRVGNGTALTFVDVAAIRGLIESAMADAAPNEVAAYEQEVKPFLTPFDALIGVSSTTDTVGRAKFIVTVN